MRRSGAGRSPSDRPRRGCGDGSTTALANADAGPRCRSRPRLASGRAVGSSRLMTITPEHRRLEIGWTWVGVAYQRTGANREAKLLQLTHAFETLGAERVEFKTHARNSRHGPHCSASERRSRASSAPHDHAGRLEPRLGLLRDHRPRMAGHQGPPRKGARLAMRTLDRPIRTSLTTTRQVSPSGS